MKDACKLFGLLFYGLLITLLLYPLLHEIGHVLATVVCGGDIKEFVIFPQPNVLCDISKVTNYGMVLIGMSGILFPALISLCIYPRNFIAWYCVFMLRGVALLSILLSMMEIILSWFKITNSDDDMIKTLAYWHSGDIWMMLLLFTLAIMLIMFIYVEHPVKKVTKFFEY